MSFTVSLYLLGVRVAAADKCHVFRHLVVQCVPANSTATSLCFAARPQVCKASICVKHVQLQSISNGNAHASQDISLIRLNDYTMCTQHAADSANLCNLA